MALHLTVATAVLAGLASVAEGALIDAVDLAPADHRSDEPVAGKWWLNRDADAWGANGGTILMTGRPRDAAVDDSLHKVIAASGYIPYRVPWLAIDPRVNGWHRIYVGLYHRSEPPQARLLAKLSDELYPEYLQTPDDTETRVAEVYWKAADLSGRQIELGQPPAPWAHPDHGWIGGISHIRLEPMTEVEVREAEQEIILPPAEQRLFGMLDYTDEVFWWGRADTENDIRAIVYRHEQAGFGRIYLRCFGTHLDNSLAVAEAAPRWTDEQEEKWCESQNCAVGWKPYIELANRFDPLQVAVEYAEQIGVEVHAWVRMTNFNREPRAAFWHDNPQFYAQMLVTEKDEETGKQVPVEPYQRQAYPRVLSFAYPEVRAFYVKFFEQLASTGTPGIMIDLLRHPPIAGYEPVVSEAFQREYGVAMETLDVYHDPRVQEHLSQYLEAFLRDLRAAIGDDIEISVRSSGPSKYALRGEEWIAEGLIDAIVDGNWYSGNGPRGTIEATIAAAGSRGKAYAVAESYDVDPDDNWTRRPGWPSPEAIHALSAIYRDKGADGFGLYESTVFTWYPHLRRAIRRAGWGSDPRPPD